MRFDKSFLRRMFALLAMFSPVLFFSGCEKNAQEEVYVAEGHSYMNDPEFKARLAAQSQERRAILTARERIIERFEALVKEAGSEEAARKLPEWATLEKRMDDCGRNFETNRMQTTALIRERMLRATKDSEKVRRGEAKAVGTSN